MPETTQPIDAAQSSARDRRALQSVATQFFVNGAIFASISPRLPEIRTRIDVSTGTLGLLLAAGALAGLLGSLSVGTLIERFGSRRVLIGGGLVIVANVPVVGYATHPAMFLLGMSLISAFDVLVDSAMNLQGSWLSGRRRRPVMNRLHGVWSLGTVMGGLAASQLAGVGVTLQAHLVGVAVTMLFVLVFVGRGLLTVDEHDPGGLEEPDTESEGDDRIAARGFAARARRKLLLMTGVIAGCSVAIELTSSDWAAFRLTDDLAQGPGVAGLAFVGFTAGMTIGRFTGDWMQVTLGQERLVRLGLVLAGTGLLLATLVDRGVVIIVGFLIAGTGVATQFPKLYDDAAKVPGRPGAALGALTAGSRIAMLASPIIVGGLAATSLSVGTALACVTLPALVGFAVLDRAMARVRSSSSTIDRGRSG